MDRRGLALYVYARLAFLLCFIPPLGAGSRSKDFTDPLRRYEGPQGRWGICRMLHVLARNLHPLMPPGMRHNDLPVHGILARNRIVALKEAKLREAAAVPGGIDVGGVEVETQDTLRALRQVQSLRVLKETDVVQLAKDVSVRGGSAFKLLPLPSESGSAEES